MGRLEEFIDYLIRMRLMSEDQIEAIQDKLRQRNEATKDSESLHDFNSKLLDDLAGGEYLTDFQRSTVLDEKADSLIVGDYMLTDHLGEGGMGNVYKALHPIMKREVAVKFPNAEVTGKIGNSRFEREIKQLSKLQHANIVSALDAGYCGEQCYLVMEYVDGVDLSTLIRRDGPLDFAKSLHVIEQAAMGLRYIHRVGIIHRDIKPANILVTEDFDVKLLDVGLAKFAGGEESLSGESQTKEGRILGTIDFMSPEQAENPSEVDAASDIYSLGCTLFFLLTGHPPFRRRGMTMVERLAAHRMANVPRLSQLVDDVPADMDPIFDRMMAKDPQQRYKNADALVRDLQRIQRDYCTQLDATVDWKEVKNFERRASQRRQWSIVAAAVLVLALASLIAAFGVARSRKVAEVPLTALNYEPGGNGPDFSSGGLSSGDASTSGWPEALVLTADDLPVDLMQSIQIDSLERIGTPWIMEDGDLYTAMDEPSWLALNTRHEGDYRLRLSAARIAGDGPLVLYLPVRSNGQAVLIIDDRRREGFLTALGFGRNRRLVKTLYTAQLLELEREVSVAVDVREDSVACYVDDLKQPAFWWSGDADDLRPASGWKQFPEPTFVIASNKGGGFRIKEFWIERCPEPASAAADAL